MSGSESNETENPDIAEFRSVLFELTTINESCIQTLTKLAANNKCEASVIVDMIESRLRAAQPEVILPILHVVDAILKHVGKEYISLFSFKLIKLLASIFPRITDEHKLKMLELRKTWGKLFPKTILFHLDVRLNDIHPSWVITTNVYVNPVFFTTPISDFMEPGAQDVDARVKFLEMQMMRVNRELEETNRIIQEEESKHSKPCPVVRFIPSPSKWSSPKSHSLRSSSSLLNTSFSSVSTASDPSQVSDNLMPELPESATFDRNTIVKSTQNNKIGKPPFKPRPLNSQTIYRRPRIRTYSNSSLSPIKNPKKPRNDDSNMREKPDGVNLPMPFLDNVTFSNSDKAVDHRRWSIMEPNNNQFTSSVDAVKSPNRETRELKACANFCASLLKAAKHGMALPQHPTENGNASMISPVMGNGLESARHAEPGHVTSNIDAPNLLSSHLVSGRMTFRPDRIFQDSGCWMTHIEVPPPNPALLKLIGEDPTNKININGVPKEIRYYGDTAVFFCQPGNPEEIRFKNGTRSILINNCQLYKLHFNQPYITINAGGNPCNVRLGAPTRELYVDGIFYRAVFNGPPISVKVGNSFQEFALLGPIPAVSVGPSRRDLVAGKITILIDGKDVRPIYLDAKPQKFDIDGLPFILKFAKNLRAILVNGVLMEVGFGPGSRPVAVSFGGMTHHFSFSALPKGVVPGNVDIKSEFISPIELLSPHFPRNVERPHPDYTVPPSGFSSPSGASTGSLIPRPASSTSSGPMFHPGSQFSAHTMSPGGTSSRSSSWSSTPVNEMNVRHLFEKLQDAGLVPPDNRAIEPVHLNNAASLRTTGQPGLLNLLHSGTQCYQCSLRFPPNQSKKYGDHLDCHFRENRRLRQNRHRKTRHFFMPIPDWINYLEFESEEERPPSFFELEAAAKSAKSPDITCSVPVGDRGLKVPCEVCGDVFDQFFCNEEEEWRLKDAVEDEGKVYHRICLGDKPKSGSEPITGMFPHHNGIINHSLDSTDEVIEVITIDKDDDTEDTAAALPLEAKQSRPPSNTSRRIDSSMFKKFSWLRR